MKLRQVTQMGLTGRLGDHYVNVGDVRSCWVSRYFDIYTLIFDSPHKETPTSVQQEGRMMKPLVPPIENPTTA